MPLVGTGIYPNNAQYAQEIINVTYRNILPTIVMQNLYKARPFLKYLMKNASKRGEGGFSPIEQPVQLTPYTNNGTYMDWSGSFNIPDVEQHAQVAVFNPSNYIEPMSFLYTQLSLARGEGAAWSAIDLISLAMKNATENMFSAVSDAFLGSRGTNELAFWGIQDVVDNGSTTAVYGNIDRTTYPNWGAFAYADSQTSLPAYQQVQYYLYQFMQDSAAPLPTMGICNFNVFFNIAKSFTGIEQMITTELDKIATKRGYATDALMVSGVPIVVDPGISTSDNTIYFVNMDHINFVYNPDFHLKVLEPQNRAVVGQYAYVTAANFSGQLVCDLPSSNFKITGFPTS